MSLHTDQIVQHRFWVAIDDALMTLRSLDTPTHPASRNSYDELMQFLTAAKAIRDGIDPALTPLPVLEQAYSQFSNTASMLSNYASNPSHPPYLEQAVAYLDGVRVQLNQLPRTLGNPAARAAVTKALREYKAELESDRGELEQRLDEVVGRSETREADVVAKISLANSELAKLEQRIDADEQRLNEALTQNNETFNTAQSGRVKAFREWLERQEESFNELAAPHMEDLLIHRAEAEAAYLAIEALRARTTDLAHLTSGDILAGQFERHSRSERISAYVAYGIGLVASVAGAAVLLFAFGHVTDALPWQSLVLKLSITAGLGGLATVAFRYGGKAIQRATSFKRQELELRALGPFLADVDGAEAAKVEFVKRAFGHAWVEHAAPGDENTVNDTLAKLAVVALQGTSGKPAG